MPFEKMIDAIEEKRETLYRYVSESFSQNIVVFQYALRCAATKKIDRPISMQEVYYQLCDFKDNKMLESLI